ncbi:protein suppressor 2 of zeste-like isoform X2 [Coccinella septempunctata]|uniref:protein suppressor 2 of zeste-like isoform X2 n=1 Tax=Coccinella septempunctata TaxID=41139 RepID=UPI001D097826|nr:protein suppressor 2 of zeste-like isoform X2 [Coccinella septempunctata]
MPYRFDKMRSKRKVPVKDLNPMLTCSLCEGYLIDATVLADCLHVFCRGCIIKYFDNCRTACPNCNIIYKKKNQICFRSDPILQSLVYKLVPNLHSREMQTREDFYRSTGVRASSSCSDDSVIDKERDNLKDQEAMVTSNVGEKLDFFSTEDMISLSIEYYQSHLDDTPVDGNEHAVKNTVLNGDDGKTKDVKSAGKDDSEIRDATQVVNSEKVDLAEVKTEEESDSAVKSEPTGDGKDGEPSEEHRMDGKRYLKCPAAVSMQLLQKFVRMKFGLTLNHRVDIIYRGEVLPDYFTLIDVAYTFKWTREKPMRFFYRIFSPMKIKPIRIINTTSTSGAKQLQIVQVDEKPKIDKVQEKPPENPPAPKPETPKTQTEEGKSSDKETLMANLQLQSTKKNKPKSPEKEKSEKESVCVYEYVEPDKEEIKRFAEKRDREWALQKKLDERNGDYYVSKKRKKSKHSKNESVHKKRKLHAEITSNEEEDLKLKVKITPHNSHKHKHHRNYADKTYEISNKEKLLQMRQVRHKHISSEDKTVQTQPTTNNLTKQSIVDRIQEKLKMNKEKELEKKKESENKQVRFVEPEKVEPTNEKKTEIKNITINLVNNAKDGKKPCVQIVNKEGRPTVKEWGATEKPQPVFKLERSESEKQKTFLKSFQSYTEKYNIEKIKLNTMEAKRKQNMAKMNNSQPPITIERKISTPPAGTSKTEKIDETTSKLLHKYPPGFTVSKIEAGFKRKAENDGDMPDKRPSLEITLIPPTSQSQLVANNRTPTEKVAQKRPLPSTIPLDRIRKSINLKSGISIIPKTPDVCDNIGALDLSNKSPESSPKPATTVTKTVNGLNMVITNRNLGTLKPNPEKTTNLSNLQMLSKVASEHPILNKLQQQAQNISKSPRPNLPSLHSLNATTTIQSCPSPNPTASTSKTNLPKLPKLTEITKTQFKITGVNNVRSPRPNPNLNIRNIPNPSLLISKQTQNRQISVASNAEKESVSAPSSASSTTNAIVEKQEIPV